MNIRAAALASMAMSASMPSAWAETTVAPASLTQVSGTVMVDGRPYSGAPLRRGDVVIATGSGGAFLTYPDGCELKISVGVATTVGAASPCSLGAHGSNGANIPDSGGPAGANLSGAPAPGAVGGAVPGSVAVPGVVAVGAPVGAAAVVGGVLVFGGVAAGVAALSQSKPASP